MGHVWQSEDTCSVGLAFHITEAEHLLFLQHTQGCLVREFWEILFLVLLNEFWRSELMASGLGLTNTLAHRAISQA